MNLARFERHANGSVSLLSSKSGIDDRLSRYFLHISGASRYYRRLIEQVSEKVLDPISLLGALPVTDKETYRKVLCTEALSFAREFTTDFSSGTVADPVIRICTAADELGEQFATEQVFRRAGLKDSDRIVCLDVGAAQIYDFYFRAARNLGASEFHYLHLTREWQKCITPLQGLQPTVIVTVPSLLVRIWPFVRALWPIDRCPVRIVIAIGESINSEFRAMIEEVWSCNICSFYGTTEIGGFAGECESKDGLHFDPELIVPTIISPSHYDAQSVEGEVCFTTLHISTHSVVKYAVGDIVRLSTIACACGEASPRLWFKSRCQEAFILAGEKFNYSMFLQVLMEIAPDTSLMTIEIEDSEQCGGTALIRFVLPDHLRDREKSIRDAFENGIFELDALCRYGLVRIELAFRPLTCVAGRKLPRLSDRRIFVPGKTVAGEPNLRGGRETWLP